MADKKEQTKAGTTTLSEEDLEKAQGGFTQGEHIFRTRGKKKATKNLTGDEVGFPATDETK